MTADTCLIIFEDGTAKQLSIVTNEDFQAQADGLCEIYQISLVGGQIQIIDTMTGNPIQKI